MRSWSCDLLPNDMRADSPEDMERDGEKAGLRVAFEPKS
jgi:hypothetical protein